MTDTSTRLTGSIPRLIPTGECWCGCGHEAAIGAFFARGHDKKAEADLLRVLYPGGVAELLYRHGFGPERSLDDFAVDQGVRTRCPECSITGTEAGILRHRKSEHGVKKPEHPCTIKGCDVVAKTAGGLRRHLEAKHS